MDNDGRVIVLVDMDCFYCQVEEKYDPSLKGKPIAVVQYNPWKGGGIIAVNYAARAMGVTRHLRGKEAKEKCPEIILPSVPCVRGKADISKYREAGKEVARVLQKFTNLLERASIDEAYMDITEVVKERMTKTHFDTIKVDDMPNTYALGYDSMSLYMSDVDDYDGDDMNFDVIHCRQLVVGALIVSEIRAAVYTETGYECSAGIAHNKILAKLVCGMNKPNKQTVLPKHSINLLYSTLPIKKVKHLGGKFGDAVCNRLKVKTMNELQNFTEPVLRKYFDEKNGTWLYNIARGIDKEPVLPHFNPKSIGCCKKFAGKSAIVDTATLERWLRDLGDEIEERLEKDAVECNRTPRQMVVSFTLQFTDGRDVSSSRSYNFVGDELISGEMLSAKAYELIKNNSENKDRNGGNSRLKMPIKFLGISVGKFEDNSETKKVKKILDFFTAGPSKQDDKMQTETEERNSAKQSGEDNSETKKVKNILDFFAAGPSKQDDKIQTETKKEEKNSAKQNGEDNSETKKGKKILDFFAAGPSEQDDKIQTETKTDERNLAKQNGMKPKSIMDHLNAQIRASTSQEKGPSLKTTVSSVNHVQNINTCDYPKPLAESTIVSNLRTQESFFQQFFKYDHTDSVSANEDAISSRSASPYNIPLRPQTPVCETLNEEEESSDSDYSASTIELEINKSKCLFPDSPETSERIDKMRSLLSASFKLHNEQEVGSADSTPELEDEINQDNCEIESISKAMADGEQEIGSACSTPNLEHHDEGLTVDPNIKCPECGIKIPQSHYFVHSDYHVALKLREEERSASRLQRTTSFNPPKSSVSTPKKTKSRDKQCSKKTTPELNLKHDNMSIKQFFSKAVSYDDSVATEVCTECGKRIPIENYLEHMDFHEAKKLHRQINKISPLSSNKAKRKRSVSPVKKVKKADKPIDSFFK